MDLLWEGFPEAIRLIASGDPAVLQITWLSMKISGGATLLSLLAGVPAGVWLALARFPGRGLLIALVNTGMGLPPVVVGLFVSILLWRSGPLGVWEFLYTPTAIVIAQFVIAAPIVVGLTIAAMQQLNPKLRLQFLGAGRLALAAPLAAHARGAAAAPGRGDGRLRRGDLRGRGLHDGGREPAGTDPRSDHGHRPGDRQGRISTSPSPSA